MNDFRDYTPHQSTFLQQCDEYLQEVMDEYMEEQEKGQSSYNVPSTHQRSGKNIPPIQSNKDGVMSARFKDEMTFKELKQQMNVLGLPVYQSPALPIETFDSEQKDIDTKQLQSDIKSKIQNSSMYSGS